MGMASRAPGLRGTDRVDVSNHALEKLRERLPAGSHFPGLPDSDLKLRVEEAWKNASAANRVEEWYEKVEDIVLQNFVVDFMDSFEAKLFGLFRHDERNTGKPVLITVLASHMVDHNKHTGKWAKTAELLGEHRLLTSPLRAAFQSVKPEVVTVNRQHVPPKLPAPAPEVVAEPAVETKMEDLEKILITYDHPDTAEALFMVVARGQASNYVNDIIQKGVSESTIQFWSRRAAKMKKTVTIDF